MSNEGGGGVGRRLLAALAIALLVVLVTPQASMAQAVDPDPDYCCDVEGRTETDVKGSGQRRAAPAQNRRLPVTGGDIAGLAVLGVALTAAGALVLVARRRPTTQPS